VLVDLQTRYAVSLGALSQYVRSLKRQLRLGKREFNVCFVDEEAMRELNLAYRGKDQATDVLSFPWTEGEIGAGQGSYPHQATGRSADLFSRSAAFPLWAGRAADLEKQICATLPSRSARRGRAEFANFLGDVVISVETARRNAAAEGHSVLNEIRWLILHGVLHLLGYDHESDSGEMVALELALREKLGVAGGPRERQGKRQKANRKSQKFSQPRL
jgi:rRNA maturation RNase YbeY